MNQSIDNFLFVDMSKTGENNHLEISYHPFRLPIVIGTIEMRLNTKN